MLTTSGATTNITPTEKGTFESSELPLHLPWQPDKATEPAPMREEESTREKIKALLREVRRNTEEETVVFAIEEYDAQISKKWRHIYTDRLRVWVCVVEG